MVKALALIGVFTYSSCDGFGHGDAHYPWIELSSEDNYRWCEKIIRRYSRSSGIGNLKFTNPRKGIFRWEITAQDSGRQAYEAVNVFCKLQRVARRLMHPDVIYKLRQEKNQMRLGDILLQETPALLTKTKHVSTEAGRKILKDRLRKLWRE